MKSIWIKFVAWPLLLLPMLVCAAEYKEGQHYSVLPAAIATQTGDKIEVLEFFWYGCPHCFQFEPYISKWEKTLPDNVRLIQVPPPLNPRWMVHTKTYYALELMGKVNEYHLAIFDAMHVKRKKLFTLPSIADYLATLGVDTGVFTDTYNSFAVEMRARKAMQLGQDYQVGGVPMMAVNGKYVITADQAGGYQQMLDIASYLVGKEAKAAN